MATERAHLIIEKVVNHLSPHIGVSALVLAGSQVEGNTFQADEFSDIELYVIAEEEQFDKVKMAIENIQTIFNSDPIILAYRNQWAGWSVLFTNLLRLELPLVISSDDDVFSRSDKQKIQILYLKPGFILKKKKKSRSLDVFFTKGLDNAIKDFWYMAVYAAQHIKRGEIWLARGAIRISMQEKVKRLLEELYHTEMVGLEHDRRIELIWSKEELRILKETSCSYDRDDVVRAFWSNIKYAKQLLSKLKMGLKSFERYERKLYPQLQFLLNE